MVDLDAAINDRFDSTLVELLYSVDSRENVRDIQLGIVHSSSDEHDSSGVEHRIRQLMEVAGPTDVTWPRLFLGGVESGISGDARIKFSEADMRHFELHGISLGKFLTRLVYDKLPIEWSTEGESSVRLSLVVDNDYVLNLVGNGTFDTAYTYEREGADLDDDEPIDSEIIYELTFTADLLYCPKPDIDAEADQQS